MCAVIDEKFKAAVIQHMNEDHSDALELYVRAFAPHLANSPDDRNLTVEMLDIDRVGVTLQILLIGDNRDKKNRVECLKLSFENTINVVEMKSPEDCRSMLVEMVGVARKKVGET